MEIKSIGPSLSSMIKIFERSGFTLRRESYELLWRFHQQIHEKNDELDLTRIKNFGSMVVKHYVDCAYVPKLIQLPSPLLDIGSGAGFPGIPIKILEPRVHLILAEGRKKRAAFLEEVCELLELDGIEVYPHKVFGGFQRPVAGVITRALETIPRTLERVTSLLPENGKAIFMKGPNCGKEIEEAEKSCDQKFELEKDIPYSIPGTPYKRRLVIYLKKRSTMVPGANFSSKSEEAGWRKVRSGPEICGQVKEIVSPNNPVFRNFVKLLKTRGIRKQGLALLSGAKQVREVLAEFRESCAGIIYADPDTIPKAGPFDQVPCYRLHRDLFRQLDIHETGQAILAVKVPHFRKWEDANWPFGCTLFVPFQDPRNVGAVIRTAAAFGVSRIVVLKEAAHPYHHASLRAAGSAVWRTEILEGPSVDQLRVTGVPMVTLSPRGTDLNSYRFPQSFCLVPGLEGPGLPEGLKETECLSISMCHGVESLNAAMATGVALYAWRRSSEHNDCA
jgi:16S rRNA (guanine(527)-N(7))-methyltransferase RsmG